MFIFLMIVHVFVSLVLIFVILMQAGRGGGVSEMFGGSGTHTIFGTSATKFLAKATALCAILFIITSLSLAALSARRSRSLMESGAVKSFEVKEEAETQEKDMPIEDEEKPIESKTE